MGRFFGKPVIYYYRGKLDIEKTAQSRICQPITAGQTALRFCYGDFYE
jgi:hypothetical protein